jgi:uncharacterized protein YneF (UPF0154 family)
MMIFVCVLSAIVFLIVGIVVGIFIAMRLTHHWLDENHPELIHEARSSGLI